MAPEPILPTSHDPSSATSLETTAPKTSMTARLRTAINKNHADIPVCLCSLVSGLCDSTTFNAASCFVSMQTGNTIFLALGASHLPSTIPLLWLRALCSIVAFLLGVFCFSKTRAFGATKAGVLSGSFLTQAAFIWIAAALAQGSIAETFKLLKVAEGDSRDGKTDIVVLAPVMLMAFQFGGQIVTSRLLGFNETPTNVLTSVYCDLMSDPKLLAPWGENKKRNRRAATVVLTVIGAIAGGWLGKSDAGLSTALWIAGAVKFGISVAFFFWKVDDEQNVSEKK